MKLNTEKKNKKSIITGNNDPDMIQKMIDEETKFVIQYFEENNIPYHMEHGIAIRDDLPDTIEMVCKKCGKVWVLPYDDYMMALEEIDTFEELEYLTLRCDNCRKGKMVPKQFL